METEALKPWRTEAYLKYVAVRQGEGNEGMRTKAGCSQAFMPPSAINMLPVEKLL